MMSTYDPIDDPDEGMEWVKTVAGKTWQEAEIIQQGIEIVVRLTDRVDEQRDKIRVLSAAIDDTREIITRQQELIKRLAARLNILPEDA
jgi:uncharacterized coiled-coil protein SlyX